MSALEAGVSAGFVISLVIIVGLCQVAFWLWFLIDALSWPRSTWATTGLSRKRWVTRILFMGPVGAVLYVRSPRRELRRAYRAMRLELRSTGDLP